MKKIIYIIVLLSVNNLFAQKEDYVWATGGGINFLTSFHNDTVINTMYVDTVIIPYALQLAHGNSCVSDSAGNLLFYSDGMKVFQKDYKRMEGGYQLAQDYYFAKRDGWSGYSQSSLILPIGESQYYLFTPMCSDSRYKIWETTTNDDEVFFDLLWYHKIDMQANNGMGNVVQSRIPLIENGFLSKPEMMAVRHANGRDWWLLKGRFESVAYHTFLVTAKSVEDYGIQSFPRYGQDYDVDIDGQCVFSIDGSKFATVTGHRGTINLFDFDRCSGKLSNQRAINVPHLPIDSVELEWRTTVGIAFSPNQKYLYVNGNTNLLQYELGETDSAKAWYWVNESSRLEADFSNSYLGPNGKLYMGNWNGISKAWSVVNNPNEKGIACNYGNNTFKFPTFGATTPPCMPNYRLGVLTGSECDTLNQPPPIVEQVNALLPNAFTPNNDGLNDYFHLLNVAGLQASQIQFIDVAIYNRLGNKVFSSNDINFKWDGSKWANDTYFYYVRYKTKEGNSMVEKGDVLLVR